MQQKSVYSSGKLLSLHTFKLWIPWDFYWHTNFFHLFLEEIQMRTVGGWLCNAEQKVFTLELCK